MPDGEFLALGRVKSNFAAAVVELGDWRKAAESTATPLSTARAWMAELAHAFRSPTVVAAPSNAPVANGPLFGRNDLLAGIVSAFEEAGVKCVWLFGAVGVGKTRLAVEAARRLRSRPGDIVFVGQDAGVAQATPSRNMSGSNGHPQQQFTALSERIPKLLTKRSNRPPLVILDGIDAELESVPELLAQWLADSPGLEILITSCRVAASAPGVQFRVPPLDCPSRGTTGTWSDPTAATQLFIHHARKWGSGSPEPQDDRVAEVVSAINGIPSHLIAAANSLESIGFEGLRARLAFSTKGVDVAPEEPHVGFRFSLVRLWDRISDGDQAILAECCVFTAGFTVSAATALCSRAQSEVRDALYRAADRGLVVIDHRRQFTFSMPGFVRVLGREHAERAAIWQPVMERHAQYYASIALQWQRDMGRFNLAQRTAIAEALPDLQTVCQRAKRGVIPAESGVQIVYALAPYSASCISLPFLREMVEALVGRQQQLSDDDRVRLLLAHGKVLRAQGHQGLGIRQLREACRLAEQTASSAVFLIEAQTLVARALLGRRVFSEARTLLSTACRDAAAQAESRLELEALVCMGHLEWLAGNTNDAVDVLEQACGLADAARLPGLEALALCTLGIVRYFSGQTSVALGHWDKSKEIYAELGDVLGVAAIQSSVARFVVLNGRAGQAREYAEEACRVGRAYGEPRVEYAGHEALREVATREGRLNDSLRHANDAVDLLERTDLTIELMRAIAHRASALARVGRSREAAASLAISRAIAEETGETVPALDIAEVYTALAEARAAEKRAATSLSHALNLRARKTTQDLWTSTEIPHLADEIRALRQVVDTAKANTTSSGLAICRDGSWFQLPDSRPVDLRRRPVLARILRILLDSHITEPDRYLKPSAICLEVWPDEDTDSLKVLRKRMYVALGRLRKMGLAATLEKNRAGYRLGGGIEIELFDSGVALSSLVD